MEKLKNILNPGHKKDDEVLYGSGNSDDPVHTGRGGAGNVFSSNKTGDDTGPTSAFSGYGNTPEPGSNRADVDKPSTLGSTNPTFTSHTPGTLDDSATTASVKSGVVGEPQSGSGLTGAGTTSTNKPLPLEPESAGSGRAGASGVGASGAGPHGSSLANKPDPRVDSDLDGSKGLGSSVTGSGLTGTSLPDRSVGSSGYGDNSTTGSSNLGRDAALGAGAGALAGEAIPHHQREGQDIGGESGRSFPLGGSSTTGANDPTLGSTSGTLGSGTGPAAGSAHQGSLGQGVPLGGAYNEESWKHDHSEHGHGFHGDPCGPEESAPGAPHFTKGPHALDTANRLDPHVSAGIGEPTESTNTGTSSMAGTGLGSSSTGTGMGSSTTGTGMGSSSTGDGHLGRDAALAGGAGAAGAGAYESSRDGSKSTAGPHSLNLLNKLDPRVESDRSKQSGTSTGGVGSGSTPTGPHSSNVGNKADPRVDSDLSGNRGTTSVGPASGVVGSTTDGTALPSDTTPATGTSGRDHHLGRDAGLASASAGAASLGAYEAGKHHGTSGTAPSATSNDPYSSEVDPRLDSTPHARTSGLGGSSAADPTSRSGLTGSNTSGASPASGALYDSGSGPTTGSTLPASGPGRDAGMTGGANKTLGGTHDRSAESYPTDADTGHHYGRDAALGGGAAGLAGTAYEVDKRHHDPTSTTGTSAADTISPSTRDPAQSSTGQDPAFGGPAAGTVKINYDEDKPGYPTSATGPERYGTSTRDPTQSSTRDPAQSHTGRDAALAGGAGAGAGALAAEGLSEKERKHQEHELEKERTAHDKELAKEEKAHQKDLAHEQKAAEKTHHKEEVAAQKHHDKDVAKAEKQHEKEVAKAEKQHEKEEKKHEKELEKEEKKKHHGGILGLFHREKPDDELKKEEAMRKGEYQEPDISRDGAAGSIQNPETTYPQHGTSTAAGTGAAGLGAAGAGGAGLSEYEQHKRAGDLEGMSEGDKLAQAKEHDRNRLHKDPPPGYVEKKLEEQGMSGSGSSGLQTLPDGRVVEPHTGLPADLSKGSGQGGTDDTPVGGIHPHNH